MRNVHLLLFFSISLFWSCESVPQNQDAIAEDEIEKYLQVPSPDWEDQILYFIVTDRFYDSDSTNNDQGAGEYKKGNARYWNGGDLNGITEKIEYIKNLGATGIWITPPVANQWINPQKTGTGNHGYWASSFIEVDKHLGTLEDYKRLSASLHKEGMYLIQDVVVNHFGDFYSYSGPYNADDVTENFIIHDVPQPTQYPFTLNDVRKAEDLEKAIYHFAPNFQDHSDTIKKRTYQFADLDDLNTENPVVRKALRMSYNFWIEEVGVDGYRFDTPHMVEHEFWNDFLHSTDPTEPGIYNFARTLGKEEFITPGEVAIFPKHFDHSGTVEAASYLGSSQKPEMNTILNFPLAIAIGRVFCEKKSTSTLTFRLNSIKEAFPRPELLFNFIDNHDGARFLTRADHDSFQQALLFIMTIPGVPVIYYGTEQELLGMRQAMFQGGAGSPDQDHFKEDTEAFKFVQGLIDLRKDNKVFRRGSMSVLRDSPSGPGAFVYEMRFNGQSALIMMNTSAEDMIVDAVPTHFSKNSITESSFSVNSKDKKFRIDNNGLLSTMLEGGSAFVILEESSEPITEEPKGEITINAIPSKNVTSNELLISGTSSGVQRVNISIDGNYEKRMEANLDEKGNWKCRIQTNQYSNGLHRITAFSESESGWILSDNTEFILDQEEQMLTTIVDEKGDDNGPNGSYIYPKHESYSDQLDIQQVKVYSAGNNLKLEITMSEITTIWLPPNGFDHLSFDIYMDLPHLNGNKELPFKNASIPNEGEWDLWFNSGGFGNHAFVSQGSNAQNTGERHGFTPLISVDSEEKKITFSFTAQTLNNPPTLAGTKLYITTWVGGPEGPARLTPEAGMWSFGGGDPGDPKIMDDIEIITL